MTRHVQLQDRSGIVVDRQSHWKMMFMLRETEAETETVTN